VAYELSIVIPTLGRPAVLARVLDRLDAQTTAPERFEVVIVADAKERDLDALDRLAIGRRYTVRRLQARRPGASCARNEGWRAARSDLVLFLDDDILPEPQLVAEHLAWHRRHPEPEVGVLGHVRWADELRVTPFMRWLEDGIQFDFPNIEGIEAGWGRFYTANSSVKRALVERVGGFEEDALPYLYEDLDMGLRMHAHGFRLLYCRDAVGEHLQPMDLEYWKRRVQRIAVAERAFVRLHPEIPAYFYELFSSAAGDPRAKGRGARLARFVPRSVPVLGPRVWASADACFKQALAEPFLEAWDADEAREADGASAGQGRPVTGAFD
jgi:GT2 family glycosyltransferase